jgi:hypothetical protein
MYNERVRKLLHNFLLDEEIVLIHTVRELGRYHYNF